MRIVLGCMTGTSTDALDIAAVAIEGHGLEMRAQLRASVTRDLGEFRDSLRALCAGEAMTPLSIRRLAIDLAELHAEACAEAAGNAGGCDLVCAHGQTIHHAAGVTWQLFDPWPIAARLGCPVVSDIRAADLATGGEGAPITPLADWILFRHDKATRAIVNLGGFCNVTNLPARANHQAVRGADICTCNLLLDAVAQRVIGERFDRDGAHAAAGDPDASAVRALSELLREQSSAGRSLGSGDEGATWIDDWNEALASNDLLASACAATGRVIGDAVADADHVLLAGGGARNSTLVRAITESCGVPVETTDDHGVPIEMREAVCMAVLGALCADGHAVTLPQVTGRRESPLLYGAWVNARVAPSAKARP